MNLLIIVFISHSISMFVINETKIRRGIFNFKAFDKIDLAYYLLNTFGLIMLLYAIVIYQEK